MLDRKLLMKVVQEAATSRDRLPPSGHEFLMSLPSSGSDGLSFMLTQSRMQSYALLAVDGSQIYPDRHRIGGDLGLVNIGGVRFSYADTSSVEFLSEVELVTGTVDDLVTPERVDLVREERELQLALAWSQNFSGESLVLFDGVLTVGHAMSKGLGKELLGAWVSVFEQFYQRRQLVAAYMSMPRTRDVVKSLQARVCKVGCRGDCGVATCKQLVEIYDRDLMTNVLPVPANNDYAMSELLPVQETTVPEHLRPWFYYLNAGPEIARVEIPAWIAKDQSLIGHVACMVADQVRKGRGYPIALSEAHEHAVVKASERELFYEVMGTNNTSTKLARKQLPEV